MVSAPKQKFKSRISNLLMFGSSAALVTLLALPILSGSNHSCPVLKEREPGTNSSAQAIPLFARKYNVDCTYCHTVWPQLNRTGLTFRYLGYRMPYEVPTVTEKKHKTAPAPAGSPSSSSQPQTGIPGAAAAQPTFVASAEEGKKIASQLQCLTCHVNGGNIVNPSKPIKGSDFAKKYPDDAQIAAIIRHGVPGSAMPAYDTDKLSDEKLASVVAFIRSLTPKEP